MRVPDPFGIRENVSKQVYLLGEVIYKVAKDYSSTSGLAMQDFSEENTYFVTAFWRGLDKDDVLLYVDVDDQSGMGKGDLPLQLSFTLKAQNAVNAAERVMWSMFNKDEEKDHVPDKVHTMVLNVVRKDKIEEDED